MPSETPLPSGATGTGDCISLGEVRADGASSPDAICITAPAPCSRLAPEEGPPFTTASPGSSTTLTWLSLVSESPSSAPLWMPGADKGCSLGPAASKPVLKPLMAAPAPERLAPLPASSAMPGDEDPSVDEEEDADCSTAPISPSSAPEPACPCPARTWSCPEDPLSAATSPAEGGTSGATPREGCRAPGAAPTSPRALGLAGSEMEDAVSTPLTEAGPDEEPAPGS